MESFWGFFNETSEWMIILLSSLFSFACCTLIIGVENKHKRNWGSILLEAILFLFLTMLVCCIGIFVFALYQRCAIGSNVWKTTAKVIMYFYRERLVELIVIPLMVELLALLLRGQRQSQIICGITACVSFLALLIVPKLMTFQHTLPLTIEPSILHEVKRMPINWNAKISNIEDFLDRSETGYFIYTEETTEDIDSTQTATTPPEDSSTVPEVVPTEPELEKLTFSELLDYIYEIVNDNKDKARIVLAQATKLFDTGNYDPNNAYDIGSYWFLRAYLEKDIPCYETSIKYFEQTGSNYMVGQSYQFWGKDTENSDMYSAAIDHFKLSFEEDRTAACAWRIGDLFYTLHYDYQQNTLEQAVEYYTSSVELSDNRRGHDDTLDNLRVIYSNLYSNGDYLELSTYLERLCEARQDNLFFNYLNIAGKLNDSTVKGNVIAVVDRLLSVERYNNSPKLLLTKAYMLYTDTDVAPSEYKNYRDRTFSVYGSNPEFFYAEDLINLAWLYYQDAEYVKAYNLASEVLKTDVPESMKSQALLLVAESYLCSDSVLTNITEDKLYKDVGEQVQVLVDSGRTEESITLRLQICEGLLGYRLGVDDALPNLADYCKKLFGTESINSIYLVAFLKYADGSFVECVELCNQMLESYDVNDYSYHEILFLKAEALMGWADEVPSDEKGALYEETEEVLITVMSAVEDDYILSLEKLHALYKKMPDREAELQEVSDKLFGIN